MVSRKPRSISPSSHEVTVVAATRIIMVISTV